MITATIGAWAVSLPGDWELGEAQDKGSYIKAPDGTKGIYVYALAATPAGTTPADFASEVQRSTIESYSELESSSWVVSERTGSVGGCWLSVADILDMVLATAFGSLWCAALTKDCVSRCMSTSARAMRKRECSSTQSSARSAWFWVPPNNRWRGP